MDETQLQQLLQGIQMQTSQLTDLRTSIGRLNRKLEEYTNAVSGKKGDDSEKNKGQKVFESAVAKLAGQLGAGLNNIGQQISAALPTALFTEFPRIQTELAGLGSELSQLTPSLRGLDGGMMLAAQNSAKLLEMGFDPLNTEVLNLAGRMGTTGQNIGVLFGSIENLIRQTDLSNDEIGGLAATVQESSEKTGVSSERIVQGLNQLSNQLALFNIGDMADGITNLTLALQTGLPAALQELPAQLIGGLVQGGPALRSILGFEGNLEEMIQAGAGGEPAMREAIVDLRDRLDDQIGLSKLSITELQAIAPAFGGVEILNQIKQLGDAFEEGDQTATIKDSFYNSIDNLMNQIKEPLQAVAAGVFNVLAQFAGPLATRLQAINGGLEGVGEKIGNYLIELIKGILDLSIFFVDYLAPLLAGAWVATQAYQVSDAIIQNALLIATGINGSLFTLGASNIIAAAGVAASTAALGAGIVTAVIVDEALDPVADGLRSVRDAIDTGNNLQQQQQTQQRLANANPNALASTQSDYERFISGFMRNNIASLMLTESGNAQVFSTLVSQLGLIATASLRTASNTTQTTFPGPSRSGSSSQTVPGVGRFTPQVP